MKPATAAKKMEARAASEYVKSGRRAEMKALIAAQRKALGIGGAK